MLDLEGERGLRALCPCDNDDRKAGDSHNEAKDHQQYSPNGVKGTEGLSADLKVEDSRENKQQRARCCRSYYSKHISDIRDKDGQHQHHTQDGHSGNDVDQP